MHVKGRSQTFTHTKRKRGARSTERELYYGLSIYSGIYSSIHLSSITTRCLSLSFTSCIPSSRCLHIPLSNREYPHFRLASLSWRHKLWFGCKRAGRLEYLWRVHSPGHTWGCAVRPGGHGGRRPAVRVRGSARARRNRGSPGRRRPRRRPTRAWAAWRSWWSPAVRGWTGGWRPGGEGRKTLKSGAWKVIPVIYQELCVIEA